MSFRMFYLIPIVFCGLISPAMAHDFYPPFDEMSGGQEELVDPRNQEWGFKFDTEQALGYYSDGALINPSALESNGNVLKIRLPQDRKYGTFELINLIKKMGEDLHEAYPDSERLQVGDISNRHGGTLASHSSHQVGLDADIVYLRKNRAEQDPEHGGHYIESFVRKKGVTSNFDVERNWELMKIVYRNTQDKLNRIFVGRSIKRAFCSIARKRGELRSAYELLRRITPYKRHNDHFHLRLDCSDTSPRCQNQQPPPERSGC